MGGGSNLESTFQDWRGILEKMWIQIFGEGGLLCKSGKIRSKLFKKNRGYLTWFLVCKASIRLCGWQFIIGLGIVFTLLNYHSPKIWCLGVVFSSSWHWVWASSQIFWILVWQHLGCNYQLTPNCSCLANAWIKCNIF